nr:unnamed protein product [Haemonchus contortus]
MTHMVFCDICNRKRPVKGARNASCQPKRNAVLLACLVKLNIISLNRARRIFDELLQTTKSTRNHKRFCREHYAESVSFLAAMVEMRTGRDSCYGLDAVPQDVLVDVLEELDLLNNRFDEKLKLNVFDLSTFYNSYASDIQHNTGKWRRCIQELAALRPPVQSAKQEVEEVLSDATLNLPIGTLPPSDSSANQDLFTDVIPKSEPQYPDDPEFPETDPTLMDRYFLVRGKKLMNLFRFCPQCGQQVRRTALTATGTAPVVHFLCDACSSTAMKWEGQDLSTSQ